jgi:hypothetical protein
MMSRIRPLGGATLALICLALGTGCTVPVGLAPATEPLVPGGYTVIGPEVSAKKMGFQILFLPFTPSNPAGKARDEAIKDAGADALVNVAVDVTQMNLLLVHFVWTTVYGIPVKKN